MSLNSAAGDSQTEKACLSVFVSYFDKGVE